LIKDNQTENLSVLNCDGFSKKSSNRYVEVRIALL